MKSVFSSLLVLASLTGLMACRQDMHDQPKYEAYERNEYFDDSLASRNLMEGTVARGFLDENSALYRGLNPRAADDTAGPKSYRASFPYQLSAEMIDRGEQRFNIFCAPCHARTGNGDGMVVRRGFKKPPTFHQERLRTQPVGYFFDVITNGFGTMPAYADQVPVRDRWAIVAYIRALQLSQSAMVADVPESQRAQLGEIPASGLGTTRTDASVTQPTGGSAPESAPSTTTNSGNTQGGQNR